ncbi:MAG: NAD(P)-binding domain-containing protein [bacterium]|nr:NAD(P)-binding domain-containing protein [bacterium]
MAKSKIVVIGAGVMGQGLAEAIATNGHDVTLVDRTTKLAEKGIKGIGESMDREIKRWGLTKSDKKAILARITASSDLSVAEDAEIVLEAIYEDREKKRALFEKLDAICGPDTVMITNTGVLSVSEIAAATERP